MKVLFITSFYSGIRQSILNDEWNPSGMPAIVKLFENLNKENIAFDNIFINRNCKKDNYVVKNNTTFSNLMHIICISPKMSFRYIAVFGGYINNLILYRKIRKIIFKKQYDIYYVDRANIVLGALLAINGKAVILRLHGIDTLFDYYSTPINRFKDMVRYLSLKAPFECIIATEDGTPVSQFLEKYTSKGVNSYALLNGVDDIDLYDSNTISKKKNELLISNDIPILIFLGRLSEDKGILEFIETISNLQENGIDFYTLIIGDGECFDFIDTIIKQRSLKNILLSGAVPHSDIYLYLQLADIFISLNKIGNLSNTVLEAVNMKKCLVVLEKSNTPMKDHSTYEFFGEAAFYIDRNNIQLELFELLKKLRNNLNLIKNKKIEVTLCKKNLPSWDDRIGKEINLIREISNEKNIVL